MNITSIPQLYRNFNRSREIISVLSKYGLADWVSRLDLEFAKELFKDKSGGALARQNRETRVRLALTELGPTFIKLGQVLSTRADMVGVPLAQELQSLQTDVPADSPEVVRATIEAELGESVEEIFDDFEDQPVASASIGQVHRAKLKTGERVAVKVRHAGIENRIRVDLEILAGLAQLVEKLPDFQNYRPRATVAEFQRTLLRELDFAREERHIQQFRQNFARDETIHVPRPYPELSTSRVLTMELLEGTKLCDREHLQARGVDLGETACRGAKIYLEMIFAHGFYHADPHPGNILVMEGNVIGLLDYGMVGRIDDQLRDDVEEMLTALVERDPVHLTSIITRIGGVPPHLDQSALAVDVSDFVSHYANLKLDEFDLSGALNEMMEMIRRYRIMLPVRITLLIKVLVMLEGTSRLLNPNFTLIEVLKPYQKKMILRRLSPVRQMRKFKRFYGEMERLAEVLPPSLVDILQQLRSGRYLVHLDHRGLEPSVNRLVFGMMTSALFLGSSWLLGQKVGPFVPWPEALRELQLSILGLLGAGVSIALGLRLIRAINKSGHLDRRR